jgi:hypothetical protein
MIFFLLPPTPPSTHIKEPASANGSQEREARAELFDEHPSPSSPTQAKTDTHLIQINRPQAPAVRPREPMWRKTDEVLTTHSPPRGGTASHHRLYDADGAVLSGQSTKLDNHFTVRSPFNLEKDKEPHQMLHLPHILAAHF